MELGNLSSGVAGGIMTAAGLFIREWWQDHKEQRASDSEGKMREELIALLRKDLEDRAVNEKRNSENVGMLAQGVNDAVQSLRSQTEKIAFVRDVVLEIKGKMQS
jgi:hypothetical protein